MRLLSSSAEACGDEQLIADVARRPPRANPTFLSLFSGCGGLDLGFIKAGFSCLLAVDNDRRALEVHSVNLNAPVIEADLRAGVDWSILTRRPDVIVAGPPCQGLSTAGLFQTADPRNSLLHLPVEVASVLKPAAVIVETVPGAATAHQVQNLDLLMARLTDLGYDTVCWRLNAADFGVRQCRKRLVVVATRDGRLQPPMPTVESPAALEDALSEYGVALAEGARKLRQGTESHKIARRLKPGQRLSDVRNGLAYVPSWEIPSVFGRVCSTDTRILETLRRERRRERVRPRGDGDPVSVDRLERLIGTTALRRLPRLQEARYVVAKGGGYDLKRTFNGKYVRLLGNRPAPTVHTKFGDPRYFLHPTEDRGLSLRETARLQGFPDTYQFRTEDLALAFRHIGNSVPPPLAHAIGRVLLEQ